MPSSAVGILINHSSFIEGFKNHHTPKVLLKFIKSATCEPQRILSKGKLVRATTMNIKGNGIATVYFLRYENVVAAK